jgi:hypothetical protein
MATAGRNASNMTLATIGVCTFLLAIFFQWLIIRQLKTLAAT